MRTSLAEMGHPQLPTSMATDNTAANNIVNGMAKQKIFKAIDMRFYWVRDRIQQNLFHIFWEEGKENLAYYVTKHHCIWHHRTMRPRYLKPKKKDIEKSKYRRTGTGRGCAGTSNPGVTRKPDNPIKGIWNLVRNGTWNRWMRGLTVQTYIDIKLSNQALIPPCLTVSAYSSELFNSGGILRRER